LEFRITTLEADDGFDVGEGHLAARQWLWPNRGQINAVISLERCKLVLVYLSLTNRGQP